MNKQRDYKGPLPERVCSHALHMHATVFQLKCSSTVKHYKMLLLLSHSCFSHIEPPAGSLWTGSTSVGSSRFSGNDCLTCLMPSVHLTVLPMKMKMKMKMWCTFLLTGCHLGSQKSQRNLYPCCSKVAWWRMYSLVPCCSLHYIMNNRQVLTNLRTRHFVK